MVPSEDDEWEEGPRPGPSSSAGERMLICWLNTQGFPSAMVASSAADLRSGSTLLELSEVLTRGADPSSLTLRPQHPGPPEVRISQAVDNLLSAAGFLDPRIQEMDASQPSDEELLAIAASLRDYASFTTSQQHAHAHSSWRTSPPSGMGHDIKSSRFTGTEQAKWSLGEGGGGGCKEGSQVRLQALTRSQSGVVSWLKKCGVVLPSPCGEADVMRWMSGGDALCDLVLRLTRGRGGDVKGVVFKPLRQAAVLRNFGKALGMLRGGSRPLDSKWVWSDLALARQDPSAVWGLLHDLKQAYCTSPFPPPPPAPPPSSTSSATSSVPQRSPRPNRIEIKGGNAAPQWVSPGYAQGEVWTWLKTVGLHVNVQHLSPFASDTRRLAGEETCGSILSDPARNGNLLCDMVEVLDETRLVGRSIRPRTLHEARSNVKLAVSSLSRRDALSRDLPSQLEGILRGDDTDLFSVLFSIISAYPSTRGRSWSGEAFGGLPYKKEQASMLEGAVLKWLRTLPITSIQQSLVGESIYEDGHLVHAPSFTLAALVPMLKDGIVLAEIAQVLTGRKIRGIQRPVKSLAAAQGNVACVISQLVDSGCLSHRYAGSVSGVVTGKRETILGILEDLLRYHEGVKPGIRVKKEGGWEEPYLGRFAPSLTGEGRSTGVGMVDYYHQPSYAGQSNSDAAINGKGHTARDHHHRHHHHHDQHHHGGPDSSTGHNANGQAISDPPHPGPIRVHSAKGARGEISASASKGTRLAGADSRGDRGRRGCKACEEVGEEEEERVRGARVGWEASAKGQVMPRGKGVGSEEGGWVVTKAESIPISEMRQEDLADPGEWYARMKALQRWLRNVPMQWPKGYLDVDDVHSFVRSWSDGVFLCDLVAALEPLVNRNMSGVNRRPKTMAACRHNIDKGMGLLREHGKGVSLMYLFCNDKFLASDRAVVMGLLEQVKKCYTRLHK